MTASCPARSVAGRLKSAPSVSQKFPLIQDEAIEWLQKTSEKRAAGRSDAHEKRRELEESVYSCRRAATGSTSIALLVGTKAANRVTTIRVAATIENASGSLGFTPNRNFASSRVRP
jgi:hypothetical protein